MGLLPSSDLTPRRSRRPAAVAAILALVAVAVAVAYWQLSRPAPEPVKPRPPATAPAPSLLPRPTPSASATVRVAPPPRRASPAPAAPPLLHVEADVEGADVFVDRRFVGKAPLDVRDVQPGARRIQVAAEGYETQTEEVQIGGEPVRVLARFKELRLDESLDRAAADSLCQRIQEDARVPCQVLPIR